MDCVRPFGAKAPWNIPVAGLARHPQADMLRDRFWRDAAPISGQIGCMFEQYTYPVYDDTYATTEAWVKSVLPSNLQDTRIRWNPAWKPASGTDGQAIVVDCTNGREFDLHKVVFDRAKQTLFCNNANLVMAGATLASTIPGDFHTKENGFRPSRGCGIQYLAMLVRPEEVAQGHIDHALSMHIRNTDGFVPPATKLEFDRGGVGIPEGTRFALQITDAAIEKWLATLPVSPLCQRSTRVIAKALRDYGWIITDTGGGANLQFEDYLSTGEKWDRLGLNKRFIGGKEFPRRLLEGLFTRTRIYAIVPSDQY